MPNTATEVQRSFRLPPQVAEGVKRVAEAEHRSINAQVVMFLEQAVRTYQQTHPGR